MSYWNNRVTKRTVESPLGGTDDVYEIREVHYDDDGKIRGWTMEAVGPYGDSLDEVRSGHELIGQAFSRPVLDITDESNPVEV